MHKRIGEKGESSFAMVENRENERMQSSIYPYGLYYREPDISVFEKTYYQRELGQTETDHMKSKEKDRLCAEEVISKIYVMCSSSS